MLETGYEFESWGGMRKFLGKKMETKEDHSDVTLLVYGIWNGQENGMNDHSKTPKKEMY